MKRPTMKQELAVSFISVFSRVIHLSGTNDALNDLLEFGRLEQTGKAYPEYIYQLTVNPRFDFGEVVKYIENYN